MVDIGDMDSICNHIDSQRYSYITLLSTDDYLPGVLSLYLSLLSVNAKYPLTVVLSNSISESNERVLDSLNIITHRITQSLQCPNGVNEDTRFASWKYTFDKLQIFGLTEYEKLVYLDSDMMVCRNIDHLFEKPHMSAVIADVFDNPKCNHLNSGLMVIQPSKSDCDKLISIFSFHHFNEPNWGDQDVIRLCYPNWPTRLECHLDISYNLFFWHIRHYANSRGIFVVHFVGVKKPWQYSIRAIYRRIKMYGNASYMLRYIWLIKKSKYLAFFIKGFIK